MLKDRNSMLRDGSAKGAEASALSEKSRRKKQINGLLRDFSKPKGEEHGGSEHKVQE